MANNPNVPSGSGSSSFEFNYPLAIEFDFLDSNNTTKCGIDLEEASDHLFSMYQLGITNGSHVRIEYDGSSLKTYLGSSSSPVSTKTLSALTDFRISFYVMSTNDYLKYKDFKVYSI